MKISDLLEDGRIVKGVNTTPDVGPNEITKQAKKFGNTVDKDGRPPTLSKKVKGKSTNVLFNLGLAESKMSKELYKQLKMGIEVEMEHTDNPKLAMKIAIDHIKEDPKYYDKLKFIHTESTDKIPVKAGHVLFSDWAKDHIAEHNKPGIGSVFSNNVNIENLISIIETLPVQGQGGPYTTKVPG